MRATLDIPDTLYARAKERARARGESVSKLVSEALTWRLAELDRPEVANPPTFVFPVSDMGVPLVDVNDRDALYRAMEE
jgi:hypothetical protein